MRIRTYVGFLLALLVVVGAAYLTHLNIELLKYPFQLTAQVSIPFWGLLLAVFLVAFLPTATLLVVQSVGRDLTVRQERRLVREGESVQRALRRGIDLKADQQWARAAEEFSVVLQARPESFSALLYQGEVLRQLGRVDEAIELHRKASVIYPQSLALLGELAADYEAAGQRDVAREIRNRILRELPDAGLAVLRRRRGAALEGRRWQEARQLHERIRKLLGQEAEGPDEDGIDRGLTYQHGVTLLEEERYAEAAEIFEGLLKDEPRFIPAAIMLGEARLLAEQEDAVEVWLEGYHRTGSPVFLQRIEDHFIERAEPARAIETLWELIGRADNDLLPRFFLGRLYYRLEMHKEALKVLESVRERIGSSPTYHFLLGRIHQRLGHEHQALEAYVACAQQMEVTASEYVCRVCQAIYPDWHDRCQRCGRWNSVELDFQEERLSPEELGVREAPVWGGYGEPAEADPAKA